MKEKQKEIVLKRQICVDSDRRYGQDIVPIGRTFELPTYLYLRKVMLVDDRSYDRLVVPRDRTELRKKTTKRCSRRRSVVRPGWSYREIVSSYKRKRRKAVLADNQWYDRVGRTEGSYRVGRRLSRWRSVVRPNGCIERSYRDIKNANRKTTKDEIT